MNFTNDFDNFINNTTRIKLDEVLESIKSYKANLSLINEIRSAIKILKRYKQTESSKWNSEILISLIKSNPEMITQGCSNFVGNQNINTGLITEEFGEQNHQRNLRFSFNAHGNGSNLLFKNPSDNSNNEIPDSNIYEKINMSNDNLIVNNNDENELAHQNFQSPEVVKCMENAALFNNVIKDKYKTSNKINIFGENKQSNNNTMFNVFNTVNQVNLGLAKQNNFDTKTENKDKLCDSSLLKNEKIFNINKRIIPLKFEQSENCENNKNDNYYYNNNYLTNNYDNIRNKFDYDKIKRDEKPIKDILNYASDLYDLREYSKCIYNLKDYANEKYPTAFFLYYYCEYLLIQQRKQEENVENPDLGLKSNNNSKDLNKLLIAMNKTEHNFNNNPFCLYLYGVILKDLDQKEEAKEMFINCLNLFPFLWGAWVDLCMITKQNEYKILFSRIDDHWMKYFFLANFLSEKNFENEAIIVANGLLEVFPNSIYLTNLIAFCYYLIHEYEISQDYFEKLFYNDPFRYENTDVYSNILFIKENYCELANLAYRCFQNDKYRPETCCVIGNFYGLKGDHTKAVIYFRRATKLDYSFLPAWTLMGHEYLEMKSIPSAIESYRTAVDIDQNDYRAWYGLGQTYEIHQMHNYALYYFMNAAKAKPNDSRMWTALGSCYEKLNKKHEAIKCYEKAIFCKDKEMIALYKMAKLYDVIGEEHKAAVCFEENIKKNSNEGEEIENAEMIESYLYLAKYHKKRNEYQKAYNYLIKLKDHEGPEKEEINTLMKEIANFSSGNNDDFNSRMEI